LYTTGRQGESKEISGRWSLGAPDEGTSREGWRGAESIWSPSGVDTRLGHVQRDVVLCNTTPRVGPPPLWYEARADVRVEYSVWMARKWGNKLIVYSTNYEGFYTLKNNEYYMNK
jgi:hypothetical protein